MAVTRLKSHGELRIPPAILEQLGLREGDPVELAIEGDHLVLRRKTGRIEDVFGLIKVSHSATLEEMEQGVREAVRKRWSR